MRKSKVKLCFNSGSLGVWVRCCSLYAVDCIRGTECPSLGRNQGRGAEIARRGYMPLERDFALAARLLARLRVAS